MKVKVKCSGIINKKYLRDSQDNSNNLDLFERKDILDIADEDFLHLNGYAPADLILAKSRTMFEQVLRPFFSMEYEICEEDMPKVMPYLDKPFNSVPEMKERLKEFADAEKAREIDSTECED